MSVSTQRRRLNNIRFTDDRIEIIKNYVKNKTVPNDLPKYKLFEIKNSLILMSGKLKVAQLK